MPSGLVFALGVIVSQLPFDAPRVQSAAECLLFAIACVVSFIPPSTIEETVDAELAPGELLTPLRVLVSARSVVGMSSARTERGFAMAFARGNRLRSPLVVETETAEDARRLREALGIDEGGFGTITWVLMPNGRMRWMVTRIVAAIFFLLLAAVAFDGGIPRFALIGLLTAASALMLGACLLWLLIRRIAEAPPAHATTNAHGVSLYTPQMGRKNIAYRDIVSVHTTGDAVIFRVANGEEVSIPSRAPAELTRQFIAQMRAPVARLHGSVEDSVDVPEAGAGAIASPSDDARLARAELEGIVARLQPGELAELVTHGQRLLKRAPS